mgnify:CR=1 FL=1
MGLSIMSSFPIPSLMITHDLFYDNTITSAKQIAQALGIAKQNEWNILTASNKATIAFWEMVRVNVMIHKDQALTSLYMTWNDLGYTNKQPHVIIGNKGATQPFNVKVSMMLRSEYFGKFAFMPLEVWNIVNDQV